MNHTAIFSLLVVISLIFGCKSTPKPLAAQPPTETTTAGEQSPKAPISAEDLDRVLSPLIERDVVRGLSVSVVDSRGGRVLRHYGTAGTSPPTDATRYQLGSVTEVFGGILLARMTESGTVSLDEPLSKHVDVDFDATLEQLASHTSGLPRAPNVFESSPLDPYAGQDEQALIRALQLAAFGEHADPDLDLGAALLGVALATAAGRPYRELIEAEVFSVVALSDTSLANDVEGLAVGHDAAGREMPPWTFDAWAPAGAASSTVVDMADFLHFHLTLDPASHPSFARAASPVANRESGAKGLGWHLGLDGNQNVRWHSGQTGGFHSFIGYDPESEFGVVILSNTASTIPDRAAAEILAALVERRPTAPLDGLPPRLTLEQKERVTGVYEISTNEAIIVRLDESALLFEIGGTPTMPLVPISATRFTVVGWPGVVVEFDIEEKGEHPTALTLERKSQSSRARRVADFEGDPGSMLTIPAGE